MYDKTRSSETNYQHSMKDNTTETELGFWCLMPLSTAFQLHCGGNLYWVKENRIPRENNQPVADNHTMLYQCTP